MTIMFFESSLSKDGHTYFYDYNAIKKFEESLTNCYIFATSIDEDSLNDFNVICDKVFYVTKINNKIKSFQIGKRKIKHVKNKIINALLKESEDLNSLKNYLNYHKYKKRKTKHLKLLLQKTVENDINNIHIFDIDGYGDYLYSVFKQQTEIKLTGTLHWYPNTKKKEKAIKKVIEKGLIKKLIVHGSYIRDQLIKLVGVKFSDIIHVIEYPTKSIEYVNEGVNEQVDLSKYKRPLILSFGSLRYDKGIDLLLDALKNVEEEYTLIVAGKENNFDKVFLEEKVKNNNLTDNVLLDIDFISDSKMNKYFEETDIVAIPYRRIFQGQSGPLTEGVNHNKLILASNTGQIGQTIINNNLGITFKCEDVFDLTLKLSKVIKDYKKINKEIYTYQQQYKERVSLDSFKISYYKFFTK